MTRSFAVAALPAAPAWWGLSTIGVSVFAALAVVGHPVGLGLTVALLGVIATGIAVTKQRDRWTLAWWSLAALLALMPALRTAGWVVALSVLGTLALAVAAAGRAVTWRRAFAAPGRWLGMLVPAPLVVVALAGRGTSNAVLRGLIGATLLVGLFGALFSASDAAFGSLSSQVVPDLDHARGRLALGVFAAAVCGALALVAVMPAAEPGAAPPPVLGRVETVIALGALLALFAAFVAVQAAALFGGDAFVRRTAGLTYAQYARSGFVLLLVVAGLTLGVVAAAARWARADRRLLVALCVLTLVILASAWHRLGLYTDAYGATRAREFAAWSILWLAGLFALVMARQGVPRAVITWSAVLGVAFGLSDPDARIAANSDDRVYRQSLSEDAAGVLGRCVDRGGGLWSVTLTEMRHPC